MAELLNTRYPAQPDSIPAIRHAVTDALTLAAFTNDDLHFAVALAVTEATSNVVRHAYPNGTPGHIQIHVADTTTAGLAITITDHGVGIEAPTDDPGMGLGIELMRSQSTNLDITSNTSGTAITLYFQAT